MGIDVHGNARIGMSHQILKALDVHTGMGHLGTEGMPEHMGCDLRKLNFVDTVLPVKDIVHLDADSLHFVKCGLGYLSAFHS